MTIGVERPAAAVSLRRRKRWFHLSVGATYLWAVPLTVYYALVKRLWARWGIARLPRHVTFLRWQIPRLMARTILFGNGARISVRGLEHLEQLSKGPTVLFVNHNSRMDGYILLAALPFAYRSFYSNDAHLFRDDMGVTVWIARNLELFFFHDKTHVRETAREFGRAREFLLSGGVLSFFPEGSMHQTRSVPIAEFGVSCMRLAIKTGAEIVPITIANSESTFERGPGRSKPRVLVSIGAVSSMAGRRMAEAASLTHALHAQMVEEYQALLGRV